jgi:dTDP-4-dehydrorhamnose 3,5-epimerase
MIEKKFLIKSKKYPKTLSTKSFNDKRGSFKRLFCSIEFYNLLKKNYSIKQINYSFTKKKGTIRGLHLQKKPYSETKIIICLQGKIFDVSVNMNKNLKEYLKVYTKILDSKDFDILIIPENYAHGFQALTNNCKILYFVTEKYSKIHEVTINPLNAKLNINWPLKNYFLSLKDKRGDNV